MASIQTDKNGRNRIQFYDADGNRQTLRLGSMKPKDAANVLHHVEHLLAASIAGSSVPRASALWASQLGDKLHGRLARVGLVEVRTPPETHTLQGLFDRFSATSTVSARTRLVHDQAKRTLVDYFGADRRLDTIDATAADDWRAHLDTLGLAPATVSKRIRLGRQMFGQAVRWGWTADNPLAGLRAGSEHNPERCVYVPAETFEKVLAACPDTEWRAVLVLSRYAGLRCPSEAMLLRWGDVLWDKSRLVVRSPKTSGHEGRGSRVVPMDPRLRPILMELFDLADEGAERVLPRLVDGTINLRTHTRRIIERAGVESWPKPLHNLRASCETDWCETYPTHVVAAWLGHSPKVAMKHYLQVRDSHFEAAAGLGGGVKTDAGVVSKLVTQIHARSGKNQDSHGQTLDVDAFMQGGAEPCLSSQSQSIAPPGFEPGTKRL